VTTYALEHGLTMKNNLKLLRTQRAWSQATLGDYLSISRQSVNAIETGRYDPSLPLAFKIARLFDLKIEEVFIDTAPDDTPAV